MFDGCWLNSQQAVAFPGFGDKPLGFGPKARSPSMSGNEPGSSAEPWLGLWTDESHWVGKDRTELCA